MAETRDNSMGSEENMRRNWVQELADVNVLSAEDNSSSTEVKGQSDQLTLTSTSTTLSQGTDTNLQLVDNPTDSSDTTSNSADTSEVNAVTASESSESTSSESNETNETSEASDSSQSAEDSNASDSSQLQQVQTADCVNGTQSCESEEYFLQNIGDDAHYAVDNLMVPEEDERELSLRR